MAARSVVALLIVVALGAPGVDAASATTVRATVDRQRVTVGEQIVMSIEVSGSRDTAPPALGVVDGFRVQYLGPATQVSIVNGSVSQSVTHRYALVAERAGRFALGPFDVSVGGERYRTLPVVVQVAASGRHRGRSRRSNGQTGPDLDLVLDVPDRPVFLHERVPISVTLYVGATRVDDVQYPQIESDVFSIEPFRKPAQTNVVRNGRRYRAVRFDTSIIPLRTGDLSIGPVRQSLSILVSNRRRDPLFGDFFGSGLFTERKARELFSEGTRLTVRPLPAAGRPAGFSGAVGQFDLQVGVQPTELKANDPITVTMRITGSGSLAGISLPVVGGDGFKAYPARRLKAQDGVGQRVVEQVVIPTSAAVAELPPVRFSYFDPEAAAYRTIVRGPIPLVVHPVELSGTPRVPRRPAASATAAAAAEVLGSDIIYLKDNPGRLRRGPPFYLTRLFLELQVVPLAAFLLALVVARRRERLRVDPRYARFVRAGREARRAIAVARKRDGTGGGIAVYDDLARAIREYLSAKLDLPVGAIDAERLAERLGNHRDSVVRRIDSFFALVEAARYAPGGDGGGSRRDAVRFAEEIVGDLEKRRGLAGRFDGGRRVAVLLLLSGVAMGANVMAADSRVDIDPVTRFFAANAEYKAGRYDNAVAGYQALVDAGFASGELYYNLGNAFLKAGDLGRAVLNYERAHRMLPRDPDVGANLAFARRQVGADPAATPAPPPLWLRLVVPLAFRASTGELAGMTSAAYTVAMLLCIARLFLSRTRQALTRGAVVAGIVVLVTGSAGAVRFVNERIHVAAVVVRGGTVPVRFEPSESGTIHFTLRAGVVVRDLDARDGWIQVARADGRRGWLEADAIERL